jgi:hypothetical protein
VWGHHRRPRGHREPGQGRAPLAADRECSTDNRRRTEKTNTNDRQLTNATADRVDRPRQSGPTGSRRSTTIPVANDTRLRTNGYPAVERLALQRGACAAPQEIGVGWRLGRQYGLTQPCAAVPQGSLGCTILRRRVIPAALRMVSHSTARAPRVDDRAVEQRDAADEGRLDAYRSIIVGNEAVVNGARSCALRS